MNWLADYFDNHAGIALSGDVQAAARVEGFSKGTVWRAATELGVISEREGTRIPSSIWRLK